MNNSLKISYTKVGLIFFLFFFLRPYPQSVVGSIGLRVIDLGVLLFAFSYCVLLLRNIDSLSKQIIEASVIWFSLFLFGLISVAIGYSFGFSQVSYRDFLDISRYIQFPIFILFGYLLSLTSYFDETRFLSCIKGLLVLIFLISLAQRLFPSQSFFITALYAPEHQSEKLFTTSRVTTLFGNPNTTSLMVGLLSSYLLSENILRKKTNIIYILISLIIVFLTGSRTGLLAFLFMGLCFTYFKIKNKKLFIVLIISIITIIFLGKDFILELIRYFNEYMYIGIKLVLSSDISIIFQEGNTFSKRFERWFIAIDYFKQSPIFGVGPMRSSLSSATDNFYLYLLLRNGLIGLLLYFAYLRFSYNVAKDELKNYPQNLFSYAYILQISVILFMNFLIEAQIQNSATYIFFITFGIILGLKYKRLSF